MEGLFSTYLQHRSGIPKIPDPRQDYKATITSYLRSDDSSMLEIGIEYCISLLSAYESGYIENENFILGSFIPSALSLIFENRNCSLYGDRIFLFQKTAMLVCLRKIASDPECDRATLFKAIAIITNPRNFEHYDNVQFNLKFFTYRQFRSAFYPKAKMGVSSRLLEIGSEGKEIYDPSFFGKSVAFSKFIKDKHLATAQIPWSFLDITSDIPDVRYVTIDRRDQRTSLAFLLMVHILIKRGFLEMAMEELRLIYRDIVQLYRRLQRMEKAMFKDVKRACLDLLVYERLIGIISVVFNFKWYIDLAHFDSFLARFNQRLGKILRKIFEFPIFSESDKKEEAHIRKIHKMLVSIYSVIFGEVRGLRVADSFILKNTFVFFHTHSKYRDYAYLRLMVNNIAVMILNTVRDKEALISSRHEGQIEISKRKLKIIASQIQQRNLEVIAAVKKSGVISYELDKLNSLTFRSVLPFLRLIQIDQSLYDDKMAKKIAWALWSDFGDEEFRKTLLDALFIVISYTSSKYITYVETKLQNLSIRAWDQNSVRFLVNYTKSILSSRVFEKNHKVADFGISKLWDLIDDQNHEEALSFDSVQSGLLELASFSGYASRKILRLSLESIKAHRSASVAYTIISSILESRGQIDSDVAVLNSKVNMIELVISDIVNYHRVASQALHKYGGLIRRLSGISDENFSSSTENDSIYRTYRYGGRQSIKMKGDISQLVLNGRFPHKRELEIRLDFLRFVLVGTPLVLTRDQFETLWDTFVRYANSMSETSLFFEWVGADGNLKDFFTDSEAEVVFSEMILPQCPGMFRVDTWDSAFSMVTGFFLHVNRTQNNLLPVDHNRFPESKIPYCLVTYNLTGSDVFWDLLVDQKDFPPGPLIEFMSDLYTNICPDLPIEEEFEIHKSIFKRLNDAFLMHFLDIDESVTQRVLNLLIELIRTYDRKLKSSGVKKRSFLPHIAVLTKRSVRVTFTMIGASKKVIFAYSTIRVRKLLKIAKRLFLIPHEISMDLLLDGRRLPRSTVHGATLGELTQHGEVTFELAEVSNGLGTQVKNLLKGTDGHAFRENYRVLAQAAASDFEFITNLGNILRGEYSGTTKEIVYRLVRILSVIKSNLNRILKFEFEGSWSEVIPADNIYTFSLNLEYIVICSKLGPLYAQFERKLINSAWISSFLELGGLEHLLASMETLFKGDSNTPMEIRIYQYSVETIVTLIKLNRVAEKLFADRVKADSEFFANSVLNMHRFLFSIDSLTQYAGMVQAVLEYTLAIFNGHSDVKRYVKTKFNLREFLRCTVMTEGSVEIHNKAKACINILFSEEDDIWEAIRLTMSAGFEHNRGYYKFLSEQFYRSPTACRKMRESNFCESSVRTLTRLMKDEGAWSDNEAEINGLFKLLMIICQSKGADRKFVDFLLAFLYDPERDPVDWKMKLRIAKRPTQYLEHLADDGMFVGDVFKSLLGLCTTVELGDRWGIDHTVLHRPSGSQEERIVGLVTYQLYRLPEFRRKIISGMGRRDGEKGSLQRAFESLLSMVNFNPENVYNHFRQHRRGSENFIEHVLANIDPWVASSFRMQLVEQTMCEYEHLSTRESVSFMHNLELRGQTLSDALAAIYKDEYLKRYNCRTCRQPRAAIKRTFIGDSPEIFVVKARLDSDSRFEERLDLGPCYASRRSEILVGIDATFGDSSGLEDSSRNAAQMEEDQYIYELAGFVTLSGPGQTARSCSKLDDGRWSIFDGTGKTVVGGFDETVSWGGSMEVLLFYTNPEARQNVNVPEKTFTDLLRRANRMRLYRENLLFTTQTLVLLQTLFLGDESSLADCLVVFDRVVIHSSFDTEMFLEQIAEKAGQSVENSLLLAEFLLEPGRLRTWLLEIPNAATRSGHSQLIRELINNLHKAERPRYREREGRSPASPLLRIMMEVVVLLTSGDTRGADAELLGIIAWFLKRGVPERVWMREIGGFEIMLDYTEEVLETQDPCRAVGEILYHLASKEEFQDDPNRELERRLLAVTENLLKRDLASGYVIAMMLKVSAGVERIRVEFSESLLEMIRYFLNRNDLEGFRVVFKRMVEYLKKLDDENMHQAVFLTKGEGLQRLLNDYFILYSTTQNPALKKKLKVFIQKVIEEKETFAPLSAFHDEFCTRYYHLTPAGAVKIRKE